MNLRRTTRAHGALHFFTSKTRLGVLTLCGAALLSLSAQGQGADESWRAATPAELRTVLPARAPVVKERIETEMRTASGVRNGAGKFVAGIVLITAGYSADGKYSHFLLAQVPVQLEGLRLPPGEYVVGWQREDTKLNVHFYDAATGALRGSVDAKTATGPMRVESFKIWPPQTRSIIQIGRFVIPYSLPR